MNNPKKLPIGVTDFKKLITNNLYFVDKSLFIEEVLDDGAEVILLPRPRRFGKTLNLSMLRYFVEKTKEKHSVLFKDLAIAKNKETMKRQGTHPVIFMTFKDLKVFTWEKCLGKIKEVIAAEFRRHKYLIDSDIMDKTEKSTFISIITRKAPEINFESALKNLSEYLHRFHKKRVFILIDEYDTPIQEGFMRNYKEDIINFMRNFLGGGLKDNNVLEKGVITGILRIAKEDIFSGLNNLEVCTILDKAYSDKFGLLENEVLQILKHYDVKGEINNVRSWYNGYRFDKNLVYNPWSIINLIKKEMRFAPYWVNTSQNSLINELISRGKDELKKEFELLISGKTIDKIIDEDIVLDKVTKKPSVVWNLLLFSGYLTYNKKKFEKDEVVYSIKIPNREVSHVFRKIISSWFDESIGLMKYKLMLKNLTSGDIEAFTKIFQKFLISSISYFDPAGKDPEKVYHAFVLGVLIGLQDSYEVKSNRESGEGRYDVILIPRNKKDLGIIIEFKVSENKEKLTTTAKKAIQQIECKNYTQELTDRGIKKHLLIGMAFRVKKVEVIHKLSVAPR